MVCYAEADCSSEPTPCPDSSGADGLTPAHHLCRDEVGVRAFLRYNMKEKFERKNYSIKSPAKASFHLPSKCPDVQYRAS